MSDLYTQGENVIFLCGYHMARDEFQLQTRSQKESVLITKDFDASLIQDRRVIFIPSEQPELLEQVLASLPTAMNRAVFFKNFDLFEEATFLAVKDVPYLVMMGDIDKCSYSSELLSKNWAAQIYFSRPKTDIALKIPELEKFKGYFKSDTKEGLASLVQ